MRRWKVPALLLLLAAILAATWWLTGERREPAPSQAIRHTTTSEGERTAGPLLRGAETERAPAAAADTARGDGRKETPGRAGKPVRGTVVDEQGAPVAGAVVFWMAEEGEPPHVTTDAEGRWSLVRHAADSPTIGVVAHGFLPLHDDVSTLSQRDSLRLVLRPGPEIVVRVQGAHGGHLELDTDVSVRPTAEPKIEWPGPGQVWHVVVERTIPAGQQEVRVRLSTASEVEIAARYHHTWWNVDPEDPRVVPAGQTVTFTVSRSCVLDFRIFDATDGAPLPRGFSYTVLQDGTPRTGGMTILAGGRLRLTVRLRPGSYAVRVWATGFVPRKSDRVVLSRPGEEAVVEVHLERDPTRGNLRVVVPLLAELPRRPSPMGESQAAPASFIWMRAMALAAPWERDFAAKRPWGMLDGESHRESDTDYLFEGVPAGEVALFAVEAVSGRVALETGIRIDGGRTNTATVLLEEGIRFDLKTVIPPDETCRSLRVRHPLYGELPTWSWGVAESSWLKPGQVPALDLALGPYPGPYVEVEAEFANGKTKKRTFSLPR